MSQQTPAPDRARRALSLFVPGLPVAQGSMRAYKPGVVVHSNEKTLKPWRSEVWGMAREAWGTQPPLRGPVFMELSFWFPRPKSLKKNASLSKDTRPDLDKLVRAVLDALTGVCYLDDAQISRFEANKLWVPFDFVTTPGVQIEVWNE